MILYECKLGLCQSGYRKRALCIIIQRRFELAGLVSSLIQLVAYDCSQSTWRMLQPDVIQYNEISIAMVCCTLAVFRMLCDIEPGDWLTSTERLRINGGVAAYGAPPMSDFVEILRGRAGSPSPELHAQKAWRAQLEAARGGSLASD